MELMLSVTDWGPRVDYNYIITAWREKQTKKLKVVTYRQYNVARGEHRVICHTRNSKWHANI